MTFLIMFIQALRAWILQEDQVLSAGRSNLADFARGNTTLSCAFDLLAAAYRDLTLLIGLPLIPDQLPSYGPVGTIIHTVACQTKGCWPAFRRGVERRYPSIPYPTPLTVGAHKVASFAELATLKWLAPLPGITRVDVHPPLAGSAMSADLRLVSVNGRSAYVEVAGMLASATSADRNKYCAAYRVSLLAKLEAYAALGLEPPVLVFVADLTPSGLAAKCEEVLKRLGLPAQTSSECSEFQPSEGQTQ